MSLSRESGDSEIMQVTVLKDGHFELLLPDGETLKSAQMTSSPKFAEISSWCDGVRNALASREERRPKQRQASKPADVGADEYVKTQWEKADALVKTTAEAVKAAEAEYEAAEAEAKKWSKLMEALGLDREER